MVVDITINRSVRLLHLVPKFPSAKRIHIIMINYVKMYETKG